MKRIAYAGLVLVLIGAGTVVFARGSDEAAVGEKQVILRYLAPAGDKELPEVVEAFSQAYPNIKIVTEAVPGDWDNMNTKLLTTFAAGTAPDLVQVPATGDVALCIATLQRVPIHLTQSRGIRTECRLHPIG